LRTKNRVSNYCGTARQPEVSVTAALERDLYGAPSGP
jgi:hypothetical protein